MPKEPNKEVEQEELTLEQVKEQIIELGKKRNSLSYKTIIDRLSAFEQESDNIDEFFEQLSEMGIELINESDEEGENNTIFPCQQVLKSMIQFGCT
jgi:RNA polymerase primary sigma factor